MLRPLAGCKRHTTAIRLLVALPTIGASSRRTTRCNFRGRTRPIGCRTPSPDALPRSSLSQMQPSTGLIALLGSSLCQIHRFAGSIAWLGSSLGRVHRSAGSSLSWFQRAAGGFIASLGPSLGWVHSLAGFIALMVHRFAGFNGFARFIASLGPSLPWAGADRRGGRGSAGARRPAARARGNLFSASAVHRPHTRR
jgi:hypothetical protein